MPIRMSSLGGAALDTLLAIGWHAEFEAYIDYPYRDVYFVASVGSLELVYHGDSWQVDCLVCRVTVRPSVAYVRN